MNQHKNAPDRKPRGTLVMRTMAMPADTNSNGDIFGGWVMSQMDLGAGVLAKQTAQRRVTTVAVDAMSFLFPVHVGDLVSVYAELGDLGTTSMRINVEVWVERNMIGRPVCVTQGRFSFVAIDETGRPIPIRIREPR
ncbi:MAG: acyl-CoA thioesterase [Gammaproteobacteria bacterium]|nr:acyl-CoA thioesterase [Gammaproteobacteria bacterium]